MSLFDQDFYPTPSDLIDRMLSLVDLHKVSTALEPSAGRGDIVERIKKRTEYGHRDIQIDTIELDPELLHILTGKGLKPVASDFLTFKTYRRYDLIIMNPPFSDGDKHLLKAIELQRDGGEIVCLLNAETIKNPYTNRRKELVQLVEQYEGTVEYIQSAFESADRRTDVEVALVHLNIEATQPTSDILRNLVKAHELAGDQERQAHDLVEGDYINGAVRRYQIETEAVLKLIDEYEALRPILSKSLRPEAYDSPILELTVDRNTYGDLRNAVVKNTRMKYWQHLFQSSEFSKLFTSKTREDYQKRIGDLERYEFNVSNIRQMQIELSQGMLQSLDDMIVRLFDEFSNQYYDEQSKNIHYYNGWKTNKAYIVNKRVITRMYGLFEYGFRSYQAVDKLRDVHKVFSYLDGELSSHDNIYETLDQFKNSNGPIRGLEFPYFGADFYKKGTAHITFRDERLLKKFNLIGSQRKGWLPNSYGKTAYKDMSAEEQAVVDEFEGQESYADTVADYEYYLEKSAQPLTLGMGELGEEVVA